MTHLKLQKLQKGNTTQQHIDTLGDVLVGNHLFVIFAVLDVSRAVNSCINHSFFTFIAGNVNDSRAPHLLAMSIAVSHAERRWQVSDIGLPLLPLLPVEAGK